MTCCEDTEWIGRTLSIQDSDALALSKFYTYQNFKADAAQFSGLARSAPCAGLYSAIASTLGQKIREIAARGGYSGAGAGTLLMIYTAKLAAEDCTGSSSPLKPIVMVGPTKPVCPPCQSPCPSIPRSAVSYATNSGDKTNFFKSTAFYLILGIVSAALIVLLIFFLFSRKKRTSFF